jgi:PAS domain S-box-containing protein
MATPPTPPDVRAALEQAHRLQRLSLELAEARNPQQVLDAVVSSGLEAAGARAGLIALVEPGGENIRIVASSGYGEQVMAEWAQFPLRDDLPLSRAILRGEPVYLASQEERDRQFPALAGRGGEGRALTCLPLIVEGRTLGGLVLSFARDEEFDEERRRFKVALARQVAQALERTRLFQVEQELREAMSFLAEAGYLLASSLDYRETLRRLAQLAVPRLADWCSVDMLSEDGTQLERLAVAHTDPAMVAWAQELGERYPPRLDAPYGVPRALRTQEPELIAEISDELLEAATEGDEELLEILRRLELRSAITVPIVARGRSLGALSLIRSDTARRYTEVDLALAVELALRAAQAVDNALLFRQTQRQADAARALAHVAEAVVLLDDAGQIRYWNQGAERLTALPADEVVGRPAADTVPGWGEVAERVPLDVDAPPTTLPLPSPRGERWLSVLGTRFEHGRVYALRDVTAERELERVRSDFVATASHELRTPLAAIYGAIRTLRRHDVEVPDEQRELFLEMIESESERLRGIVAQLLVAGQLDADSLSVVPRAVPVRRLVEDVMGAARLDAPKSISFRHTLDRELAVVADEDLLRQVLRNLLDNAVKYSPGGGEVHLRAELVGGRVTITVADQGLGIPDEAQPRIFEKFFRVDPELTRGVRGTGLGLYIASELTRRMSGRLSVVSTLGEGSAFVLDLPHAG